MAIGHGQQAGRLAPPCQLGFLDNGYRCGRPTVAYVKFHMVGHCRRFDCDVNGDACGYVCAEHLEALDYTAQCTLEELQASAPPSRPDPEARCLTCGVAIHSPSDVLRTVVEL